MDLDFVLLLRLRCHIHLQVGLDQPTSLAQFQQKVGAREDDQNAAEQFGYDEG